MTTLWAKRHSVAYGWRWTHERQCSPDTAQEWLAVFQRDEPNISFALSDRKPR
jgi:hypothetical protein